MATLRGEQGAVQFETGSGSLATVVGTRSWSLTITKETYETTDHGDTFRNVVKANDATDASFELFTTGTSTGTDSLAFGGIITDMEITSTVGELVVVSCNFVTSGTITSNLQ